MTKISKTTKNSGADMEDTVVFFGSGPVAAESLRLLSKNFKIEAVITKPKPDHHKGAFPVIELVEQLGLRIHTVSNKTDLDALIDSGVVKSKLGVLIDFGIIVSQKAIDYFPLGIVNSHFSILPEWRGADPITFSILSGQQMTGVSLMLLVEKMDEGPLIGYGEQPLEGAETTPTLTEQLILLSDALLAHELPRHMNGETKGVSQDITGRAISYSRKLTKDDGILDWNKPAEVLEREIRAFIGWPKSRTQLAEKDVIITKAHVHTEANIELVLKPGDTHISNGCLMVACNPGYLCIEKLKPAGKNEMTSDAFIAGHKELLNKD